MLNRSLAPRAILRIEQLEDRVVADATSFVKNLYNDVLARPAKGGEVQYWTNQINSGSASYFQVGTNIWRSEEHRSLQIVGYYRQYLGRSSVDQGGMNYWLKVFGSVADGEVNVQVGILNSPEFANRNPTDAQFLRSLYQFVLNRPWDGRERPVQSTDRGRLAQAILTGTEYYAKILLPNYYKTFFGRTPDDSGKLFWLNKLENGQVNAGSLARTFLGTDEYINLPPKTGSFTGPVVPSPGQFLTTLNAEVFGSSAALGPRAPLPTSIGIQLEDQELESGDSTIDVATQVWDSADHRALQIQNAYEQILGRSATDAEVAGWVAALEGGTTLVQVETALLVSPENLLARSTSDFIQQCYRVVLGRSASNSELAYWTALSHIHFVALADLAQGILTSPEADGRLVESYYAEFQKTPDPSSEAFWTGQLVSGEMSADLLAEVLAS
jgi:hypothetical protein